MGLSRRFLNLIVDNRIPGAKSLHCIDLRRHKLFNTTIPVLQLKGKNRSESELLPQDATPWADDHKNKIAGTTSPVPSQSINLRAMGFSMETCVLKPRETPESESCASDANDRKNYNQAAASVITRKIRTIQLPQPIMKFRCSMDECDWYLDCLPLAGHKVLCIDPSARTVLFDVGMFQLETIPCFNVPKRSLLPCWIPLPSTSSADAAADGNGSFYIFESSPYQEELNGARQQLSNQFVAFVYHRESKSWQRQLLPPPPFVDDPKHYEHYRHPDITSYAVVERGGSHVIFLSVDGAGGPATYCLDTVTHTWSYVGDWVLPFKVKVEYVPELKLWFGICTEGRQLGAADLSTMDSQPQIVGTWKELEAPGHWRWREAKPPQLVNLGSGRFCITRFFRALLNSRSSVNPMAFCVSGYDAVEDFTVLTGIDVVPCVHDAHGTSSDTFSGGNVSKGKVELQMIKHNSRRHMSDGSDGNIEVVF
ncbi:hypothetical protein BDA96_09G005400 [Sorghum bicolor]|uniref:Uncharacterized protein n=1 Tax=Sorghum bicolor TaxID=4558 RepID=A0A921U340_SORBI|nr:hypothetical protein BDA96_09G005400 [Sorghum bicolor]KAG0516463.1 hypothetical protein BDA96_09G005400 [Sorghum bicolor]